MKFKRRMYKSSSRRTSGERRFLWKAHWNRKSFFYTHKLLQMCTTILRCLLVFIWIRILWSCVVLVLGNLISIAMSSDAYKNALFFFLYFMHVLRLIFCLSFQCTIKVSHMKEASMPPPCNHPSINHRIIRMHGVCTSCEIMKIINSFI